MVPARNNMFLVCVTVGLVFLASKYRNNVLRSVKHLYKNLKSRDSSRDNGKCKVKRENTVNNSNNTNNDKENDDKNGVKLILDKIILADSPEKCDYAVQRIRCNLSGGVLGFDCEWVKEGPVSLLQLATYNGVVALFRLGKIGYVPPKLKELLASKQILKVGIASFEDGQKIVKDYGCRVSGTLDLRTLSETLRLPSRKSLAAMSLEYLNIEMDKIVEVRCGDWDVGTLSDEQVAYAACDALASVIIYHKIRQKEMQKYSLWQRLGIYLCNMLNSDVNVRVHGLPAGVVDTRYRAQRSPSTDNTCNNIPNVVKRSPITDKNNNSNIERKNSIPTRIKPLYHNCYLQAPDGDILCTCDRKKAEWYITKKLGELVSTEPFTVRLNFEPSGRALGEVGQYYTQVKVNQCVVCGCTDKFIRKNVVPREYRKYFPLVMKAHQSHDVLLLCPPCHEISNSHDLQLRRKLADMCDAPLIGPLSHVRDKYVNNYRKLHSAVKALNDTVSLPSGRREEFENFVLEYTGKQKITPDLLSTLNEQLKSTLIQQPLNQCKYQPHGLKVVQYFQRQEGGLIELERMWREHFLITMNPKHLPSLWSVRHNQERLIIRQAQNRIEPQDAKVAGLTK
ncbi:Exonuclease 3'-5' domain-containing protein [Ooceraea biroi]|uniref:Exonuclease 3'-5' domain-containing protein n=1 Tax=Ooceraea biroi TaxID=2015173 RepID=A0A026WI19_OOCBI|nr:Exonuclease 3'-5' domain-containing protein [Ooceraea biroi]